MSKKPNAGPAEGPGLELDAVPEAFFKLACTNTALRRATRRLGQLYDDAIGPLGLKATQFGLLAAISELTRRMGGPDTPTTSPRVGSSRSPPSPMRLGRWCGTGWSRCIPIWMTGAASTRP